MKMSRTDDDVGRSCETGWSIESKLMKKRIGIAKRDLRVEKTIVAIVELKSESNLWRCLLPQRLVMVLDEVREEGQDHEMRPREDQRD
jgi:hypothetical protein